jgi:hypothetical protein
VSQGFDNGTLACNANCLAFNTAGCSNTCTLVNLLTVNPSFDSGPNGGGWNGSPQLRHARVRRRWLRSGGGTGPFNGSYWAWFGGTTVAFEETSVSRSVVIPPAATLQFSSTCRLASTFTEHVFTASIDGTVLFTATNGDAGCGVVGYELKTFDVSAIANGASHTLSFAGSTDDFDFATNFFLDDVQLLGCQ